MATPKQSGGGGFTFEDKVTATYLLMMLAGDIPLRADVGFIEQVRVQNRVDGWYLDDIVLLLKGIDDGSEGIARSRFIQKLAGIEADEFLAAVPVGEFDSDECRLSTELIASVCTEIGFGLCGEIIFGVEWWEDGLVC